MSQPAPNPIGLPLDRPLAQIEWLRLLPEEARETLRPRAVGRLLEITAAFMQDGRSEHLAELETHVYGLARALEAQFGQESSLRFLRDALVHALAPAVRASPASAEAVGRVISRVTDSVWKAHTDVLEETIQAQTREGLRRELTLAKRIQERLLPRTIPKIPGFDIGGRVLPAAEVGGDYWSCKEYEEENVVTFKLADVTGHGIAAATLVAAVKFISGGYFRASKTAAEVMERTNRVLVRETPSEILVTMVYGWLHPQLRELSVVNAGHSPVLFYHAGKFRRIEPTGGALGLIEGPYREVRLAMEPGDIFFTCSDGVTDPGPDGALGERWAEAQVATGAGLSAVELVDRILERALAAYGTPLDDMSVLVIKRTG
jgi:hypothetical protein